MPVSGTMTGAELVGKVVASQALLIALMEAYIDRPDVDDAKAKALLETFRQSGKLLAKQLNHPQGQAETEAAVDSLIDILTRNLPQMRGEFGLPGGTG